MKKAILAIIATAIVGTSALFAGATALEPYAVKTFETKNFPCEKDNQWDYLSYNVTYNAQSDQYVTNSCHAGNRGYTKIKVYGTDLKKVPIVGLGVDGVLVNTESGYDYRRGSYKMFTFAHEGPSYMDINGTLMVFYYGNSALVNQKYFIRNP